MGSLDSGLLWTPRPRNTYSQICCALPRRPRNSILPTSLTATYKTSRTADPAELVYKYVLAKDMTDGYERLWREGRLDLAVENVAWRYRRHFPPEVGRSARSRLEASGFDVLKQKMK